ncbi:hypothetical protein DINM_005380 [Dirofilaria immitis]|nr:hypothetical protein [Dirofilaria immitis]
MTAEMRDMINQLMGTNRAVEEGRRLVPYNHHTVCRAFLLGCCPHEILADTRLESLVACNKVHESAHKADYENAQKQRDHFTILMYVAVSFLFNVASDIFSAQFCLLPFPGDMIRRVLLLFYACERESALRANTEKLFQSSFEKHNGNSACLHLGSALLLIGFERLEEAIRIVDKEIERTKEKLKKDCENEIDQAEILKTQMIGELGEKIGTTIVKMEALGNEGKVEEAMELSKTIEEYKRKKRDLENDVRTVLNTPQVRLRVCDMCGAQLSLMEHETRLADHYGGKMHCGMETIREQYIEMKKTVEERRAEWKKVRLGLGSPRDDRSDRDRRDHDYRGREHDYDSRDRERDRDRDRNGDRLRDKDRDRRRSRSSRRRSRSLAFPVIEIEIQDEATVKGMLA